MSSSASYLIYGMTSRVSSQFHLVPSTETIMPAATEIHPNDCHVSFNVQDDDENPRTLKIITVIATHPAHQGPVASIEAIKILRRFCKGQFLDVMDEDSDEMHQFSVALFDKFGKVKPWLISEGHRSGTGCWGEELNVGELIYIKDINVNAPVRFNLSCFIASISSDFANSTGAKGWGLGF